MENYSKVDQLSNKLLSAFAGKGDESLFLKAIMIINGVLSALFFLQFGANAFAGYWLPFATIVAMLAGLIPSEGAFFGWKHEREKNTDMTTKQIETSKHGLNTAVATSIFSTIALFVATMPFVPEQIGQHAGLMVFIAIALPISMQTYLYSQYTLNKRSTVENFERAKLSAMIFSAHIRGEQAKAQAILDGRDKALETMLEGYGKIRGQKQADKLLSDGNDELLEIYNANTVRTNGVQTNSVSQNGKVKTENFTQN